VWRAGALLLAFGLGAVPAMAGPSAEALAECAQVEGAEARLACFDALAAQEAESPREPESPDLAPGGEEAFGLEDRAVVETPDALRAQAVRIDEGPRGLWIFTLDNGQVWKQQEARRLRLDEDRPAEVLVRKHVLGFTLKLQDNRPVEAERLR